MLSVNITAVAAAISTHEPRTTPLQGIPSTLSSRETPLTVVEQLMDLGSEFDARCTRWQFFAFNKETGRVYLVIAEGHCFEETLTISQKTGKLTSRERRTQLSGGANATYISSEKGDIVEITLKNSTKLIFRDRSWTASP